MTRATPERAATRRMPLTPRIMAGSPPPGEEMLLRVGETPARADVGRHPPPGQEADAPDPHVRLGREREPVAGPDEDPAPRRKHPRRLRERRARVGEVLEQRHRRHRAEYPV